MGDLNDILNGVEEDEPTGIFDLKNSNQQCCGFYLKKYRPATEEQLRKAFELLDPEKKEYLSVDEIQAIATEEGEPFTQEEMEEMLSAAVDPDKGLVYYNEYISMMAVDDDGSW